MQVLCIGCDLDLAKKTAVFVGQTGPMCDRCASEVEAMRCSDRRGRPIIQSWKDWRWVSWFGKRG